MVLKVIRSFVVATLIVSVGATAFAQTPPAETRTTGGPRRQLATILFAGLGGAVLGLSTLSFYGRPQDNLKNIAYGFAAGVVAGTAYVTFKAATNPAEFYGTRPQIEDDMNVTNRAKTESAPLRAPTFAMTFDF